MPMRCLTGRSRALREALLGELSDAMKNGREALYVLVPEQFTLEAELDLFDALALPGSFRLQVLSPARLYARVFEQAGRPKETRVDDRGRVMLMYASLRALRRELQWYKNAQKRPGFAELAAGQLAELKQAGFTAEALADMAQDERVDGALRAKLADLSVVWTAYDQALSGRFLDGEDELRRAVERMPDAPFLRDAAIWAYGFELVSPSLAATLCALSGVAKRVTLLLALDERGRDARIFAPVAASLARLRAMAAPGGFSVERTRAEGASEALPRSLRHLESELFCENARADDRDPKAIQLVACKSPRDEARFAAGLARELVRTRGWRWSDVAVCYELEDEYATALQNACRLYDVPVFVPENRPAGRHPAARYLILSLRAALTGFRPEDMLLWLRTGYTGLSEDETDRLSLYAFERGLRGKAWLRPLTRGDDAESIEPLRERACAPLAALAQALPGIGRVADLLSALWTLLESAGAFERLEAERDELTRRGFRVEAGESAQVWNRIVGAFDQMHELLGAESLSARDVCDMLEQSLLAASLKPLPQSVDALSAGSLSHLRSRPVKALILLGMRDRGAPEDDGLFRRGERAALSERVWLAPSANDRLRLNEIDVKAALSLARRYVVVTYPLSTAEGAAAPGRLPAWLTRLFPRLAPRGGLSGDDAMTRLRYAAPNAALDALPSELRAREDGTPLNRYAAGALEAIREMPEHAGNVARARAALTAAVTSDALPPAEARTLYGGPTSVSVSRLEQEARCPFAHFVRYGLRPIEPRPYEFTPANRGEFLHRAMELYMADGISESLDRMDEITEALLSPLMEGPLGENAVLRAQGERLRAVARTAARVARGQLESALFEPCAGEMRFGDDGRVLTIDADGEPVALHGRIDRVDRWLDRLRVVDYKSGGAAFSASELRRGLQLQLIVYLAAALRATGCKPAGAYYFHLSDPTLPTEERDPETVRALREAALRLDGISSGDPDVLAAMDAPRAAGVSWNRDGTVSKSSRALSDEEFERLVGVALEEATRLTRAIRDGATAVEPIAAGTRSACRYCPYAALCQIDPTLPGGRETKLPRTKLDDLIAEKTSAD